MSDTLMRIKIGAGTPIDIVSLGFHFIGSPSELAANVKESSIVTTDFPEEDGVEAYVSPIPSKKEFDYPISFLYFSDNLNDANGKIHDFYESLLGRKITIYNDYKKVMVVGYAKSYKNGSFYRNEKDVVEFEINFLIPKPSACNFNYTLA